MVVFDCVLTLFHTSEILYEDASFTQRELAALVASKVSCVYSVYMGAVFF